MPKDWTINPLYSIISPSGMNMGSATKLQNASRQDDRFVYAMLETSAEGITNVMADERRAKFGPNEVQRQKAPRSSYRPLPTRSSTS